MNSTLTARGDEGDLRRGMVSGGLFTALARAGALAIQVVVGVIQARHLTPAEFGLFGMVTTITSFVVVFREFGLSYATIQKREISYNQVNALFWVNALVGLFLAIITTAAAWPVATLYRNSEIIPLTAAMSTVFLLGGISVQHAALLRRKMRYREIAVAEVGSAILGALSGLALVLWGGGVWALVAMQIVKGVAYNLLVWKYLPWLPTRPRMDSGIRSIVGFGSNIMAFDFVTYFSKNADKILIGRLYGPETMGFYVKAIELISLPITLIRGPLTVVGIPALSALQDARDQFERYFLAIAEINAALCVPISLWLAIGADFLIPYVLGPQWDQSVPYFRHLSLAGVFQSTVGIMGTMLIASGNTGRYLAWGALQGSAMLLCYLSMLFITPVSMTLLFIGVNAAAFVPSVFFCTTGSPVRPAAFLAVHVRPFLFGAIGVVAWMAYRMSEYASEGVWSFILQTGIFFVLSMGWTATRWRAFVAIIRP